MLQVNKYVLGPLQTNCYIVNNKNNAIIIDPAYSPDFLAQLIHRNKYNLTAMVATHGHIDHVMAAGLLQKIYPVPFYIHKKDLFLLKNMVNLAKKYIEYIDFIPIEPKKIKFLNEGTLHFGSITFNCFLAPGHTPGSCVLHNKQQKIAFVGDVVFKNGVGRYDFNYANKEDLKKSIKKIKKLPKNTLLYPGHGNEFYISNINTNELHQII